MSCQNLCGIAAIDPSPDGIKFEPLVQVCSSTSIAPTVLDNPLFNAIVTKRVVHSDGQDFARGNSRRTVRKKNMN